MYLETKIKETISKKIPKKNIECIRRQTKRLEQHQEGTLALKPINQSIK